MTHVSAARYWRARSEPYLRVPLDVLEWSGSLVRAVWIGQAVFWATRAADAEGWVDKTIEDFEAFTTLSKTAQYNVKRWLKGEGLLETKTQGLPRRTLWRLDLGRLTELVEGEGANGDVKPAGGSREDPQEGREKTRIPIPEGTEEEGSTPAGLKSPPGDLFGGTEKAPPPSKPKGKPKGLTQAELAEFERWYAAYPKKVAKGAARRAWRKARAQFPDGEAGLSELIRLTEAWWEHRRATEGPSLQYVPGPGPWLNAERWGDELAEEREESDEEARARWRKEALERQAETQRMLREQRGGT